MRPRPDDNNSNLIIAMVLSMLVILGWQYFIAEPAMREARERQKLEQQVKAEQAAKPGVPAGPQGASGTSDTVAPAVSAAPGTVTGGRIVRASTRDVAIALSPRLKIETPRLSGSIGLKGGRIDDLKLTNYREKVDPKSPNIELFSPTEAPSAYFADFGWSPEPGATVKLPNRDSLWTSTGAATLTPSTPVELRYDNGEGLVFTRKITVDANYMFTVTNSVQNNTGQALGLRPFGRIFRDGPLVDHSTYVLHEGLIGFVGEKGLIEQTFAGFAKKDEKSTGFRDTFADQTGGWLGVTDKYWAAALIPPQSEKFTAIFAVNKRRIAAETDQFETRYELAPVVLAPGAKAESSSSLYAGAKDVKLIDVYEKSLGITKFNLMIDWGWFYFITKPLFYLLDWIYGAVGNFGIAIIGVTIIVKILFFPLANASYASMAKMKKVQPEMERLKERYKDDKEKQAKELMSLYQKEGINPLAGCLPVLLQIPVFFALYKVLNGTIDMRHAPFVGWIKDLSAPDPTSLFNLFGLLPYAVPDWLAIGIWPIIMGITMWMQMQLSPPPPDPVQQQVFAFMPPMLTIMLATAPAGLVIYWAVNNVLSIAQQVYIMKKLDVEVPFRENVAKQWSDIKGFVASVRGKSEKAG
ncbi:MAG: membrane protein insertase YidC [Hyphomicrobiaceae bacterium]|nr:membrane protein insertase YidC [Hyphomicrobiaceae bacterium]